MTDLRIFLRHLPPAGFCSNGARRAAPSLGLDFRRFAREGIPVAEIEHMDDANVQRIIAVARKEAEVKRG